MSRDGLDARAFAIAARAMRAARATFTERDKIAYTVDPVFEGLERNRPNAELMKAALRLPPEEAASLGYGPRFLDKVAARLIASQKPDGCWHEIHPRYDAPSALATAFMAEALLSYRLKAPSRAVPDPVVEASLRSARDYILANEFRPGFFRKSEKYLADHLNVDASCGAFLAQFGVAFNDNRAKDAATRTVRLIAREQFPDGAYPYTTADNSPPYPYPLHVPCIHYQGVTGYYLAKIDDAMPSETSRESLLRAGAWLASVQQPNGSFDWARSHMMFAYHLSAAYAFGAALFVAVARWDSRYLDNAERVLDVLDSNVPGLAWRWETARLRSFPLGLMVAMRSGWHPRFPATHNLARLGYGAYRQLARRRQSQRVSAALFHFLRRTMRLQASTVEPSKNFPDLFMTSEIADCLTYALAIRDAPSSIASLPAPLEANSP